MRALTLRQLRLNPETIAAARERTPLSQLIGREIKLTRRGPEYVALCPFHNERTPSFTVNDAKGFFWCFGCGAHGDAIGWRMRRHGESFPEAVEALNAGKRVIPRAELVRREREREERDTRQRERCVDAARELWYASRPIAGTPAERYLRARGIQIPLPRSLRFHPELLHGAKSEGVRLPGLVAGVQNAEGRIVAIHRIFLDPATCHGETPQKTRRMPQKALLGGASGGAVRLTPIAARMGVCEGIETGLAVLQALGGEGLWSGIDATHMALIDWPETVASLTVFADRDPLCTSPGPMLGKRPGEEWARRAAANFLKAKAGRTARIAVPPGDKVDFNDVLRDAAE